MFNPPHRIRRQRWVVRTGSQAEAFEIRKLLNDRWQGVFLPSLANAFEEMKIGTSVLHIPKLEIRVKVDSVEQFTTALPDLISQLIREQLERVAMLEQQESQRQHSYTPVTEDEDRFEALVQYLRTGDLLWHQKSLDSAEVVRMLAETAKREQARLANRLLDVAAGDAIAVLFRWLQITAGDDWPLVAEAVIASRPPGVRTTVSGVLRLLARPTPRLSQYARLRVAALLIAESIKTAEQFVQELAHRILLVINPEEDTQTEKRIKREEDLAVRMLVARLPELCAAFQQDQSAAREIAGTAGPHIAEADTASLKDQTVIGRSENPLATGPGPVPETEPGGFHLKDQTVIGGSESPRATSPGPVPETERGGFPLAVSHSGLILLHPYFSRFFEKLGIKQPGETRLLPAALSRGAALLHFLATGRDDVYEFELGLIKVLLGLQPESELPVSDGLLNEQDREEAQALLAAVTAHWKALGNTSVHGLRASFLQRQGLLAEDEQGWRLQVEPRSFDVLLNYLPWAISTVRLPWATKPIYTDWRTP